MCDNNLILAKIGSKCPYCGEEVLYSKDSDFIYGRNYGGVFYCKSYPKCDAYVGTHNSKKPKALGRLANEDLRLAKKRAHKYFDRLWKAKMKLGYKKQVARSLGYKWLSQQLGIEPKYTHIGMFDIETCQRVVFLCKPYSERLGYKD